MTQTFTQLRHSLLGLLFVAASLLAAAPALASTMYFVEVLTASEFSPAPDVRATLDAGVISSDPLDILLEGQITPDSGLGSGYLSGTGDFIQYTHRFTPALAFDRVTHATLMIGTIDDQLFDSRESVEIELNDVFWAAGRATFSLFGGNVTALFSNNQDELKVAVISRGGDSIVPLSMMMWRYETAEGPSAGTSGPGTGTSGAAPVPEPTALALFGIGTLLVRHVSRRGH